MNKEGQMNREEWINLDEAILIAKLQKALKKHPGFHDEELRHKMFLIEGTLRRWHPYIRVSLEFVSYVLETDIRDIQNWYNGTETTRDNKRIIWKTTFIPYSLREAYLHPEAVPEYSIDEIYEIVAGSPPDVPEEFFTIAQKVISSFEDQLPKRSEDDITLTCEPYLREKILAIRQFLNGAR